MSVILVAEMEAKTRRMLRRFLEGCKLEVQAAANLQEAQGLLAAARIDALVVGLGACALGGDGFDRSEGTERLVRELLAWLG